MTAKPRIVGQGVKHGQMKSIYVALDPDTFDHLASRAKKEKTSMSEQIRTMVEWGLESEKKHL